MCLIDFKRDRGVLSLLRARSLVYSPQNLRVFLFCWVLAMFKMLV
jgi:hypothetical protein